MSSNNEINNDQHQDPEGEEEGELPTSGLKRPDPDSILADEADPDALLGHESDSETGGSRRASAAFVEAQTDIDANGMSKGTTTDDAPNVRLDALGDEVTPTKTSFQNEAGEESETEAELQAKITDLTNQVTGLNNKLVNSFMRVSDLEDDVSESHNRIMAHTTKIAELEKEREEHLAALNTGLLVEKEHVSTEMQRMMERVIDETAQRGKAISDKEKIEAELDELSSSLFSEANKMVAVERLARARAEEKSKQMEERLRDTEEIMEHQQKRLVGLQGEVEKGMKSEGKKGSSQHEAGTGLMQLPSTTNLSILPMVQQQLLLDIVPYVELRSFLNHLRRLRQQLAPFFSYPLPGATPGHGRSASGSPAISRSSTPGPEAQVAYPGINPAYGPQSSSPFLAAGVSRHKDYPSLPSNCEQLVHLPTQVSSLPFLKRANEEDVEPCLRLDFAPGLNWLSRRQVQTSIFEGGLVIEPVFGGGSQMDEEHLRWRYTGMPPAACAMCGKPIVNVPPHGTTVGQQEAATGSTSNWINAANNAASSIGAAAGAGLSNAANALPNRESSASPPVGTSVPSSGGLSVPTASSSAVASVPSEGKKEGTLNKSRSGLFSTLRSMSGASPRPSLGSREPSTSTSGHVDVPHGAVEEDTFAGQPLPMPTHIFRINETSNTRYLLCPHHCLRRLRAACAFWGYVRNLERAVVLEGKFAWDHLEKEEEENESRMGTTELKRTVPPTISEKEKKEEETREENSGGDETAQSVGGKGLEKQQENGESLNGGNGMKPENQVAGKHVSEVQDEERESGDDEKIEDRAGEPPRRVSSASAATSSYEEQDDGFADAQSSPVTERNSPIEEGKEIHDEKEENGVLQSGVGEDEDEERKRGERKEDEKVGEESERGKDKAEGGKEEEREEKEEKEEKRESEWKGDTEKMSNTEEVSAATVEKKGEQGERAALPSRSSARKNSPSPVPPALPPRRSTLAPPQLTSTAPKEAPRRTLELEQNLEGEGKKEKKWTWEEKVWWEVTRLKADMWLARVGSL